MSRLGFIILSIMKRNEATARLSAMTVREIALAEIYDMKENTVFKKLREFEKRGFVARGLKDERAATFYVTAAGLEFLEEIKKSE